MAPRRESLLDRFSHRSNLAAQEHDAGEPPYVVRSVVRSPEDGSRAAGDAEPHSLPAERPAARPPRRKPHALLVDDDQGFVETLAKLVGKEGFTTSTASTLADAHARAVEQSPDVLFTDLMLPDGSGLELLKQLEANGLTDAVLITGHATVETAVQALRQRVTDYLVKPVDVGRVKVVLANVARARSLREEINSLRTELRRLGHFGPLLGASPAMGTVYDLVNRVAATEATVLVMGESGTGKDLVAQTIHQLGRRRLEPFLPVNCGAISPNLIESELFGHERGSFTGADRLHKGHFERANGGTLFLDEITEMPIELQSKLLRVLETGAVIRIGGELPIQVDVRVIAATNRVPEEAVAAGKLREDLLYRLNVFPIELPPLRERGEDLELLASSFLEQLNKAECSNKTLSRAALQRLRAHSWPGNVRELKNVLHRAFILADEEIGPSCFPRELRGADSASAVTIEEETTNPLVEAERRVILATLEQTGGDKRKAASVLGISMKTLYKRLRAYNNRE
jgi:two-component system, NtrC family, response regulator HydG